jgi:hypothetical protein
MNKYEKMIENKQFITPKRNTHFHKFVAERFKSWTMWFPGCVVHHWDENPCNNHPLNLGCMTASEHSRLHSAGVKKSDEFRKACSDRMKGIKRGPLSEETKTKIKETLTGVKHTQEHRTNISKSLKGKPQPIETCIARGNALTKRYIIVDNTKYTIKEAAMKFELNLLSLRCAVQRKLTKHKNIEFIIV